MPNDGAGLAATLEASLPPTLRGPDTRITPMSDSWSGAGVYRVDAAGQAFVLKIAPEQAAPARWRRAVGIWRSAAAAGLTPDVVHVDEATRAVLTALVVDQSFAIRYRDAVTHDDALAELGRTLRGVHALPLPTDVEPADVAAAPLTMLASTWATLASAGITVPDFVRRGAEALLAEAPPDAGHAPVLSHNDVHPKNLVHDGARLYLMDWDVAGPNDPFYDLATIAVFFAMNQSTCCKLLGAYGDVSSRSPRASATMALPERFLYDRRLVAMLCGVGFVQFGFRSGYTAGADAAGAQTPESVPTLTEFHQRMRAGTISLATGEGRWAFGLALARESVVALT